MKILVGADPELFLRNPNSGAFVSGHGMIQGTKHEPFPVRNGAVQVDGTALEFNIDPADSVDSFVGNVQSVMGQLRAMVPGYDLALVPVADYAPEYFRTIPEDALELGCDPDFSAYTGEANERPVGDRPFRTASGHIHIGWTDGVNPRDPNHFEDCKLVCRQLDYYLGAQSLRWDPDNRRRSLYGKAGAFRPKSYGCEYRVMSNVWLSDEALMRWVYNACVKGVTDLLAGHNLDSYNPGLARTIIDENQVGWWNKQSIDIGMAPPPSFSVADKKVA